VCKIYLMLAHHVNVQLPGCNFSLRAVRDLPEVANTLSAVAALFPQLLYSFRSRRTLSAVTLVLFPLFHQYSFRSCGCAGAWLPQLLLCESLTVAALREPGSSCSPRTGETKSWRTTVTRSPTGLPLLVRGTGRVIVCHDLVS